MKRNPTKRQTQHSLRKHDFEYCGINKNCRIKFARGNLFDINFDKELLENADVVLMSPQLERIFRDEATLRNNVNFQGLK